MDKHMEKERRDALREWASPENRRWIRIRTALLTATAVMLVMSAVMGTALAYFTTYAKARGWVTIHLGHQETVTEDFNSWEKTIEIESTNDSRPVYLRARTFCADYDVTYDNSQNWEESGDWMYYTRTLAPGRKLSDPNGDGKEDDRLKVKINGVPKNQTEGAKDGQVFNVIVVYESTEIQYDDDGNALAAKDADWNQKVDTNRTSTTLGGED